MRRLFEHDCFVEVSERADGRSLDVTTLLTDFMQRPVRIEATVLDNGLLALRAGRTLLKALDDAPELQDAALADFFATLLAQHEIEERDGMLERLIDPFDEAFAAKVLDFANVIVRVGDAMHLTTLMNGYVQPDGDEYVSSIGC